MNKSASPFPCKDHLEAHTIFQMQPFFRMFITLGSDIQDHNSHGFNTPALLVWATGNRTAGNTRNMAGANTQNTSTLSGWVYVASRNKTGRSIPRSRGVWRRWVHP